MGFSTWSTASGGQNYAASTTYYGTVATGGLGNQISTTEADLKVRFRTACTLSRLMCVIGTNDRGASTLRLRINGANGTQSVSIPSSTTGEFVDTSGEDTVAAGDDVNTSVTTGAGGTDFRLAQAAGMIHTTGETLSVMMVGEGAVAFAVASTTYYWSPCAALGLNITQAVTEATHRRFRVQRGTFKRLAVNVSANTRTTDTTVRGLVDGSNGNMSAVVPGSTTGLFEDTSNSDTLANNAEISVSIATGTGTGTLSLQHIKTEYVSIEDHACPTGVGGSNLNNAAGTDVEYALGGGNGTAGSPAGRARIRRGSFTAAHLQVGVSVNSLNVNSVVVLRRNAATSNLSITVASGTTGRFADTTNLQAYVDGDSISFRIETPAGTGTLTMSMLGCLIANGGGRVQ